MCGTSDTFWKAVCCSVACAYPPQIIDDHIKSHHIKSLSLTHFSLHSKSKLIEKVNWIPWSETAQESGQVRMSQNFVDPMGVEVQATTGCISLLQEKWCWNSWKQPKKLALECHKIPGALLTTTISPRYLV